MAPGTKRPNPDPEDGAGPSKRPALASSKRKGRGGRRPGKTGDDNEDEDMQNKLTDTVFGSRYLDNFFDRLDERSTASPKFGKVSKEELDQMLKVPVDENWSEDDQRNLERDWESDPIRIEIAQLTNNTVKHIRGLWKVCAQHLRCPPTDIISEENHLRFASALSKKVRGPDSPIWTEVFANAFQKIMFHELWRNGHVKTLVMVLQFAVIVRTDDRRTWELENPTTDRFIDNLVDEIRSDAGELDMEKRRTMVQLCKAANRSLVGRAPSLYYVLFRAIIKYHTAVQEQSTWGQSFEEMPYYLFKADLDVIATALEEDVTPQTGVNSISGQALTLLHVVKDDSSRGTAPSSLEEVQRVLRSAVLASRARRVIRLRAANQTTDEALVTEAEERSSGNEAAEQAAEKVRREKESAEKAAEQQKAAEKARLDREAAERAAEQHKAFEKARLDREAAERVAEQHKVAEKARLDREAAEKAAKQQKAAEKARLNREAAEQASTSGEGLKLNVIRQLGVESKSAHIKRYVDGAKAQLNRPTERLPNPPADLWSPEHRAESVRPESPPAPVARAVPSDPRYHHGVDYGAWGPLEELVW